VDTATTVLMLTTLTKTTGMTEIAKGNNMTEKETAFWLWYDKIKDHENLYNLHMAFDAGYDQGKGQTK
jgi:hypothetical protein